MAANYSWLLRDTNRLGRGLDSVDAPSLTQTRQQAEMRHVPPQHLYLSQASAPPALSRPARLGEFTVHCATQNVLHPVVAQAERDPRNRDNKRFAIMANHFARQNVALLNTQESTAPAKAAFEQAGYRSIDADMRPVAISQTSDATDISQVNTPLGGNHGDIQDREQKATGAGIKERDWRGLTSYYDPSVYELDDNGSSRFDPYDPKNQKSWPQVWSAFGNLIRSLVSQNKFSEIQKIAGDFVVSFSGVARKDGLLVSHLRHIDTGKSVILCNTHLESFDHNIRQSQIEEMISRLQKIRQDHTDSIIIIAGDFNTPQISKHHQDHFCEGLAQRLMQSLGAISVNEQHILATLINGVDIDGVYFMPPQGNVVSEVSGETYLPKDPAEPDVQWSDHCSVIASARLSHLSA
jgi:hypothetical protein